MTNVGWRSCCEVGIWVESVSLGNVWLQLCSEEEINLSAPTVADVEWMFCLEVSLCDLIACNDVKVCEIAVHSSKYSPFGGFDWRLRSIVEISSM